MKVAIATRAGRVCQRLDCADGLVVLQLRSGREQGRQVLDLTEWPEHGRPARLERLDIDELICGAVGAFDEAGFEDSRIRLISGVSGPVQPVVAAVLKGAVARGRSFWHETKTGRGAGAMPDGARLAGHGAREDDN